MNLCSCIIKRVSNVGNVGGGCEYENEVIINRNNY